MCWLSFFLCFDTPLPLSAPGEGGEGVSGVFYAALAALVWPPDSADSGDDENEDDEEFHIRDIIAWRTVGTKHPQEQFKVQWEDWDDIWHTEEELLAEPCKWKLAESYHDRKVLRSKLTWVRSNTRHTQNKG